MVAPVKENSAPMKRTSAVLAASKWNSPLNPFENRGISQVERPWGRIRIHPRRAGPARREVVTEGSYPATMSDNVKVYPVSVQGGELCFM